MHPWNLDPYVVLFICATVTVCTALAAGAAIVVAQGGRWLDYQIARLRFAERSITLARVATQESPVETVLLLRCACGQKVSVNAALAMARPGRMIQKCGCGEVVWPPRESDMRPAKGVEATRPRLAEKADG